MECELSSTIYQSKTDHKGDDCMKLYDETKPLFLENDASDVGLETGLLQTREGKSCP